jgi:hypothetical protein
MKRRKRFLLIEYPRYGSAVQKGLSRVQKPGKGGKSWWIKF